MASHQVASNLQPAKASAPPRRAGGRPPHQPTEETRRVVRVGTAYRLRRHLLAEQVGIDEDTLRKHYAEELATRPAEGPVAVKYAMEQRLIRRALAGNVRAARLWLSPHGGREWRPNHRIHHTNNCGFEGTEAELDAAIAALQRAQASTDD